MNKLKRILALVLLLAVAVTAFAVLPTFAEETEYGNVLWDSDSKTISTTNLSKFMDVEGYADDNGQKIWSLSYDASKHEINEAGGCYFSPSGLGKSAVVIRDFDENNPKNVDYLVIDLDISTDSELFNSFYFNSYLYATTGKRTGTGAAGRNPHFRRDANGRIYLTVEGTSVKNTVYHPDDKGNKWVNVTLVYDFHKDGDTVTNKAYAYFDGIFAGEIDAFSSATSYISNPRMQFSVSGGYSDMSMNLANFTFKTFDVGYTGPLTESGKLGNADVNLADLADLAYTQQNCPENPEGYDSRPVLATVTRTVDGVATTTEVRDVLDLKTLVSGDIVTVRRSFTSPLPHGVLITRGPVTWLDYKGVNILAPADGETAAVTIPTILEADADADWAVVHNDPSVAIYAQGKAEDIYVQENGVVIDPLFGGLHSSKKTYVVLFDDVVTYGPGPTGSTITSQKSPRYYGFEFDLMGHTLTVATVAGKTYIAPQAVAGAGSPNNIFRDGTLNYGRPDDPSTEDVNEELLSTGNFILQTNAYDGSNSATTTFKNLTLNVYSGTLVDQRSGKVVYENCTVNTPGMLTSLKSNDGIAASLEVINCDITLTDSPLTTIKNVSNKYGSLNCSITIEGSTIRTKNHLVNVEAYPHSIETSVRENEWLNDNVANITISNSEIITTSSASNLVRYILKGYADDGSMSLDASLNISASKIKANKLFTTSTAITEENVASVNIDVSITDGSSLLLLDQSGNPSAIYSAASADDADANITLVLADGTKLNTAALTTDGTPDIDSVVFDSDASKIVYSSIDAEYLFIVSDSYDTWTYQLGALEAVPFYWNIAEGETVDVEKVYPSALLDKVDGVYHYVWSEADAENKAFVASAKKDYGTLSIKNNLTLHDYIHFNVFIEVNDYDLLKDYVTVTGAVIDAEAVELPDGNRYYKFQHKNIAPKEANDTVVSLAFSIPTSYGESVVNNSKDLSVLSYAASVVGSEDEASSNLIKAILNYIATACDLAGYTDVRDAAEAIIPEGTVFADMVTDSAKTEGIDGVKIAVRYGDALYLGIKGNAGDVFTVTYVNSDDETVTATRVANSEGEAFVAIKACDFANDMTVTKDGQSATVNVQGYYLALGLQGEAEAQVMVEAIYNYAVAAAAYKASLQAAN